MAPHRLSLTSVRAIKLKKKKGNENGKQKPFRRKVRKSWHGSNQSKRKDLKTKRGRYKRFGGRLRLKGKFQNNLKQQNLVQRVLFFYWADLLQTRTPLGGTDPRFRKGGNENESSSVRHQKKLYKDHRMKSEVRDTIYSGR